jgi:hypothetical protein
MHNPTMHELDMLLTEERQFLARGGTMEAWADRCQEEVRHHLRHANLPGPVFEGYTREDRHVLLAGLRALASSNRLGELVQA